MYVITLTNDEMVALRAALLNNNNDGGDYENYLRSVDQLTRPKGKNTEAYLRVHRLITTARPLKPKGARQ